jgi:hypothetical protein
MAYMPYSGISGGTAPLADWTPALCASGRRPPFNLTIASVQARIERARQDFEQIAVTLMENLMKTPDDEDSKAAHELMFVEKR